jgi:beta-galactosidase
MIVGVDYYPEHWDSSLWQADADAMRDAGITVVRLAEFAWSRLEPREGQFDFDWLDRAIAIFAQHDIRVVLGTPTATPPNWLVEKHPDILPLDAKKQPVQPGVRWHRCYNSPSLRHHTEIIVDRLARHYAGHPAVIGWQTDNELAANDCHCEHCTHAFRAWVRRKYGSLGRLNAEWGTVVWSGEYSAWSQLNTPLGGSPHLNPSFLLDFQRFSSDSVADYNDFQAGIIRRHCPTHFVTHNVWGYPVVTDYYRLFENMDFTSVDYYPSTDLLDDSKAAIYHGAMTLDLTRGIKRGNFWVMEQLSGTPGCWNPMSRTPFPGMIRAHAWQSVSRGADAIIHFRWRSARQGAEQFWHGLLDHHGIPGRRFAEFKRFAQEARQLSALLDGTTIHNDVAILYSHEQHNAFKIQPQSDGFDYLGNIRRFHRAFVASGVGTDVIDWRADITDYKLVVAPYLYLEDAGVCDRLAAFVAAGGHLVLTTRSGVKYLNNQCQPERLPGALAALAGVHVDEYDPVGRDMQQLALSGGDTVSCAQWCDILIADGATELGHYTTEFFAGRPAVTCNTHGNGRCYYIGTVLDQDGHQRLLARILSECGIETLALPPEVEVSVRSAQGRRLLFVLNLGKSPREVVLPERARRSALDGRAVTATLHLPAGAVEILEETPV